jgi:hypothetical protein
LITLLELSWRKTIFATVKSQEFKMKEIICPNCQKAFKVDEAGYATIQKQVRDNEFEEELRNRVDSSEREKDAELTLKLSELKTKNG